MCRTETLMLQFSEVMQEVKALYEGWLSDETLKDVQSPEEMQMEMLQCIQGVIGSDFVILTKEQHQKLVW